MKRYRVAVYGTLRPGCGNCRAYLSGNDVIHLGTFRLAGFRLYDAGPFPFAGSGEGAIVVDLFEIGSHTLAILDRLEGHPKFYRRREVTVDGASAWMYAVDEAPAHLPTVWSGDWMNRQDKRVG